MQTDEEKKLWMSFRRRTIVPGFEKPEYVPEPTQAMRGLWKLFMKLQLLHGFYAFGYEQNITGDVTTLTGNNISGIYCSLSLRYIRNVSAEVNKNRLVIFYYPFNKDGRTWSYIEDTFYIQYRGEGNAYDAEIIAEKMIVSDYDALYPEVCNLIGLVNQEDFIGSKRQQNEREDAEQEYKAKDTRGEMG